ncbi:MAG: hypothetical protein WAM66_02210 [Acidobacteriaceae bacterium]
MPLSEVASNTPLPYLPLPQLPDVIPPVLPAPTEAPAPPKKVRHVRPRHVTVPATPEEQSAPKAQPTPEQIANGVPTDTSPIGQLSAAGESTNLARRREIVDEINSTEKGLNEIKHPLSKQEQTTATQIRTFIEKAKQALTQADLDGAHTLVTKARVLLNEIVKS